MRMGISAGPFARRHAGRAGFTFVVALLSLVILACSIILIVKGVQGSRERSRRQTFVQDLTQFEQAFQLYHKEFKKPPAASSLPGEMPLGMERFLRETHWSQGSPFGGRYVWISPCPEVWLPKAGADARVPLGAVSLTAFAPDAPLSLEPAMAEDLREEFDFSSRPRGKFTSGFNGWPLFIVYPRP